MLYRPLSNDWLTWRSTYTVPQLVIPKVHGAKLADIPDDHLTEILVWESSGGMSASAMPDNLG